jgi:hypothetical protein
MVFNPFEFLVRLDNKVNRILSLAERIVTTMVTRAEFDAKLDEALTVLTAEIAQVKKAIEDKVPPEIDLAPEFKKLSALVEGIKNIIPDPVPVVEDPAE